MPKQILHPSARITGAVAHFGGGAGDAVANPAALEKRGFVFLGVDKTRIVEPTPADRAANAASARDTVAAAETADDPPAKQRPKIIRDGTRVLIGSGSKARYRKACQHPGCTRRARYGARGNAGNYCVAHGGGVACEHPQCSTSALHNYKFCIAHGGGPRCTLVHRHPGLHILPYARFKLGPEPKVRSAANNGWMVMHQFANAQCCYQCYKSFVQ